MTNGNVKCWGENTSGQLGDHSTTDRLTPVNVWGFGAEQTPPERVESPIPTDPVPPPLSGAIVITHGWNSNTDTWVREMANRICTDHLGATQAQLNLTTAANKYLEVCRSGGWGVWIVDWRNDAGEILPETAWRLAKTHGDDIARLLFTMDYGKVHFIAHSAGANLIDTATKTFKDLTAEAGRPQVQIHATFLDAYDPRAQYFPYIDSTGNARHVSAYGRLADFVDNYVDTRPLALNVNGSDLLLNADPTDLHLPYGYNIDVTPATDYCDGHVYNIKLANECRHGRPYRFYGHSVAGDDNVAHPFTDDTLDLVWRTKTMGFPRSLEGGGTVSLLAGIKNAECRMQDSGSCVAVPAPTAGLLWYFPIAFGKTLVDTTVGTITYVVGAGVTMFNSIKMGAGLISALSSSSVQPQARMSSSVRPMTQAASTTPTESPSWIVALPTTTQPVNTLRFNWRFAAAGEGFLRVFVDGNLVRELDQRHVPLASVTAEDIYIGGADGMLPAGTHRIAFRLDGFGASASGVELTNVELGAGAVQLAGSSLLVQGWNLVDEAVGVPISTNVVVTFSAPIQRGTGNIVLKNASGAVIETFDAATSGRLSISGAALTINPTANLNWSAGYKVEVASGTAKDLAGNSYAGTTSYNFTTTSELNESEVEKLYIAYFNRPGDLAGLAYWEGLLANGVSMTSIQNSFSSSAEYQAIYIGQQNTVLITKLYHNLFGREVSVTDAGVLWWANEMTAGSQTITTIAGALSSGTTAGSADNIAIIDKIVAASEFTDSLETTAERNGYVGAGPFAVASNWLAMIHDDASFTTAMTSLNATIAAAVVAP